MVFLIFYRFLSCFSYTRKYKRIPGWCFLSVFFIVFFEKTLVFCDCLIYSWILDVSSGREVSSWNAVDLQNFLWGGAAQMRRSWRLVSPSSPPDVEKNMTFACVLWVFFWSAVFHRVATQARSRKNVKNLRVFRESGVKMLKNPIVLIFSDEPEKPPRAEPSARFKPAEPPHRNPYK